MISENEKTYVKEFWNEESCGERHAQGESEKEQYDAQAERRYVLEPYIHEFARFETGRGKDVLEIGVGMGADHAEWARSEPRSLTGVDLTPRAVEHTTKRFSILGFQSDIRVGDAENLPFDSDSFDVVYSWGVLHHSPDTCKAIDEAYRVLRPGGVARIMIYHKWSLTGYMLWMRYGLLSGHPLRTLEDIYSHHLESPGTKAFTIRQAEAMSEKFSQANIRTQLSFGDLLMGEVGQRHKGFLLTTAKRMWPRPLIRTLFRNHGLMLLIEGSK